jgi:hypothetical protein
MTDVVSFYIITKNMARHLEEPVRAREILGQEAVQVYINYATANPEISHPLAGDSK